MMQQSFKGLTVCHLVLLIGIILFFGACRSREKPYPATDFVYQQEPIISEKAPAPPLAEVKETKPLAQSERTEAPARLSLIEAVGEALKNNQKIQVSAYDPKKAVQDLKAAEAVYGPSVFSSANAGREKRPTNSLLDTGTLSEDVLIENKWFLRAGSKKFFPSGTTVSVYQELDRLISNSTLVIPDPQSTSRLVVEVSQPLLKGFWDRGNRATITIAKLNVDISNEEFRQVVMDVVAEVTKLYWQLLFEREAEYIAHTTMDMAKELYRRENVRMQRGISSQLDADRALTAAKLRRADLLRAQTRVKSISDQLKLALNMPVELTEIIPVSQPQITPTKVDLDEALKTALKNRPELERAQKTITASKTRKDLAQHNRLPKLDAVFRLSRNGLGVFPGRALDTAYTEGYNSWLAAVEFEYPLNNQAAKADYAKRSLEYDQSFSEANRVKDQIITEVSLACREVNLAQQEIPTTLQAKIAAIRVVEGENERYELGQKSNEELLRAQDFLALAAREYARSVTNYNISLATLNRVKGTILRDLGIEIKTDQLIK